MILDSALTFVVKLSLCLVCGLWQYLGATVIFNILTWGVLVWEHPRNDISQELLFCVCECSCFCGSPHIRDNILFFWHGFLFLLLLMWRNTWIFPWPREDTINHIVVCPLGILLFFCAHLLNRLVSLLLRSLLMTVYSAVKFFLLCSLSQAKFYFLFVRWAFHEHGYKEGIKKNLLLLAHIF